MDQLLEGIPVPGGTKKRQVLRASAARDPLSSTGEWRTVRPLAPELIEFQRAVMVYAGGFSAANRPANSPVTTVCSSADDQRARHRFLANAHPAAKIVRPIRVDRSSA